METREITMYHTRPIKTFELLTALIDRGSDDLVDVDKVSDEVVSNSKRADKRKLFVALSEFRAAYLENRDG